MRNVFHRAYVMAEGDTIRRDVLESLLPAAAVKPGSGSAARAPLPKPPKSDKPDKKVAASRKR
jgi:hypothetical protein